MNRLGDVSLCLTMGGLRMHQAEQEFKSVCLDVEVFEAIPGYTPFESFNMSQYAMIGRAYHSGAETASLFEDDVIFKNAVHLTDAILDLPTDWQVCYLGANITGSKRIEKIGQHLRRIDHAWTTHAVMYSKSGLMNILKKYNPADGQMFDDWLAMNIAAAGHAYCVAPMICWQRPGQSDLWGKDTDYTPCFEQGNKMMGY